MLQLRRISIAKDVSGWLLKLKSIFTKVFVSLSSMPIASGSRLRWKLFQPKPHLYLSLIRLPKSTDWTLLRTGLCFRCLSQRPSSVYLKPTPVMSMYSLQVKRIKFIALRHPLLPWNLIGIGKFHWHDVHTLDWRRIRPDRLLPFLRSVLETSQWKDSLSIPVWN